MPEILSSNILKKIQLNKDYLLLIVCSAIIAILFNGYFDYGLYFDKVYRVNNIIQLINPKAYPIHQSKCIFNFFGYHIPLMYKSYVSSITDLRYLPLYFFDDYNFGLKLLDLFFFILTILLSYVIVKKYSGYAFVFALLLILNPILYPEILFGFIYNLHVLLFLFASHLLYRYYSNRHSKRWLLFGGFFFLFFSCNLYVYSAWILLACFVIIILFFRKQLMLSLCSLKDIFTILLAFIAGLFNYIYYNVTQGFPTIQPFFVRLFSREIYNKAPIDHKQAKPFIEDINYRLGDVFPKFYGEYFELILAGFLVFLIAYIIIAVVIMKRKLIKEYKYYFIPIIGFVIVYILILLSPNTSRAGHYIHLSPFLELSIICIVILYNKIFPMNWVKSVSGILVLVFLVLNFYISYSLSRDAFVNKGTGFFSPAIINLNNYLDSQRIDYADVKYPEWGIHAQLYFLNKGEVKTNNKHWELISKKEPELSELIRKRLIADFSESPDGSIVYFPLFCNIFKSISKSFLKVVDEMGGIVRKEKVFYELNGKEAIYLYSVTGIDKDKIEMKTSN